MEKLIAIQNELKVPKGNFNSFGKYKYRSAEDILEAVKPILVKHNATLTLSDEAVAISSKIFIKATASLRFSANDSDLPINVFGYAETGEHKGMSAEQTTGTASSYARKYALNGLFLIDETEADADSQKPQERMPTETPANDNQYDMINALINTTSLDKEKVKSINERVKNGMGSGEANKCIDYLKANQQK